MTNKQTIYGRWEYWLGEIAYSDLCYFYKDNKVFREDGIQVGGISCARNATNNTAILMTYDSESELMLILKFASIPNIKHTSHISI